MCWAGKREKNPGLSLHEGNRHGKSTDLQDMQSPREAQQTWFMQTEGAFPEQKDSKTLPVLPQFPPLIKGEEYMLSLPLKDRAKSFTDLVN